MKNQSEYISSSNFEKDKRFWQNQLSQLPSTISFKKASKIRLHTNEKAYKINKTIINKINDFCTEYAVSKYIFLLSIFSIYFRNAFNSNNFIIGTAVSNKVLPIIVKLHDASCFLDFSKKLSNNYNRIFKHMHFPYSEISNIVKEKYNISSPLYDIVFSYSNKTDKSLNKMPLNKNQTETLRIYIFYNDSTLEIHYSFLTDVLSTSDISIINEYILDLINTILCNPFSILKGLKLNANTEERVFFKAVEKKDTYTSGHSNRVSAYSVLIGKHLNLSKSNLKTLEVGGLFHDIGKIGVSDSILLKKTQLTDDEYSEIKNHTSFGANLLSSRDIFKEIVPIVKYHHEKYDGSGYPNNLSGNDIPYFARITAIADSFDAMTSRRTYNTEMPIENVVSEFKRCRGTQFDPELVDVMLDIIENHYDEIKTIQEKYKW